MKKLQHSSLPKIKTTSLETLFAEVVDLIQQARQRTFHAVNTELIDLYWQVGEYISHRIAKDGWGKGTVAALASYIQKRTTWYSQFLSTEPLARAPIL
jgi:hypothetical protein